MASTYSSLKIELIGTGDQAGAWGATTNTNLGTAIEQAITGSVDIVFASADVTLTLTDSNAAQNARALRLNLTGTSGGARNLYVPAIYKQYIVNNGLADAVTVKNATGTGIAVPAGKTMIVFNNATDVVDVTNYSTSLTLGSALPTGSGGTGLTSFTSGGAVYATSTSALTTGTLPTGSGGTGLTSFTSGGAVYATSTSALTTGTLPVTSGGTGQTSFTDGQLLIGNSTGNTLTKATLTAGSGITITNGNGSISIATITTGGDVVGPASATDNAFARFDGTTGKLIKDSTGATLDNSGSPTFTSVVNVSGTSTTQGAIRLYEDTDNGTNYVAFQAPALIASNLTWTLPSTDGTVNQVLSTNGAGTLSWQTAASSAASGLVVQNDPGSFGTPSLQAAPANFGFI